MSCSYKADDIGIDPEEGIEETISEKMIVLANTMANGERYWFDDGRFNNYVDVASDEDLIELLEYFDDIYMINIFLVAINHYCYGRFYQHKINIYNQNH